MHYDYIIVGAGSAGCVLAGRLSEDPAISVLLIEAGGSDRRAEVRIPAAFPRLFKGPRDWAFESEPEPTLADRRLFIPRGRMLGGSSSMNAMLYVRGNRCDYDGWRRAGCDGWSYLDVLPAFKRSEDQERGPSRYHGVGGPLSVSDPRDPTRLSQAYLEAAEQAGLTPNADFNGAHQEGVGVFQVTQRNGARCSTADAFLRPALQRPNLRVETTAMATRLFVKAGRVFGVEFRRGRQTEYAFVDREVIAAAGAIGSPQLLMLSGIGPAAPLERAGIVVEHDLPGVGGNLHDHLFVPVSWYAEPGHGLEAAESPLALANWMLRRRGPLTSPVAEGGAFVRTEPGLGAPDLQLLFAPTFYVAHGFDNPKGSGLSIAATLLTPRSRGRIGLRSTDPADPPRIEGNYLESGRDLETLIAGVHLGREIGKQPAFDRFRRQEFQPGAGVDGDAELARFVRITAEALYHPVGTCKMGIGDDAVVDPSLRLRGLVGLRIVDASVMPVIPRGNTNAPTIMIAERAAEMLRDGR